MVIDETTASSGYRGRSWFLDLQKKRWVLDFDKSVYVFKASLHQSDLRLDWVVAEGDWLPDNFLAAGHEVGWKKLYKLVLNVLNEIQFGSTVTAHNENGKEGMRLFDAGVHHLNKDVRVFVEVDHQFLGILHSSEGVFVDKVRVMEEEIVLRGKFNFYVLDMIVVIGLMIRREQSLQGQGS